MPIEILGQAGSADIEEVLRQAIRSAIPEGEIEVGSGGPGHFQIRVVSAVFHGQSRVRQQQLVYGAIAHLMSGANAPVHAIDRLECVTP